MLSNKLRFIKKYLKYKLFSKHRRGYGIHSPFLYKFVREILYTDKYFYAYDDIAELRYDLLGNDEQLNVNDFGAGSKIMKTGQRKICDIVKYSAISEKFGEMLFRIVEKYKPETILELGTSLGIGTLYLSLPNPNAQVYTIEGCSETAKIASKHFNDFNANNIKQRIGNIDDLLPKLVNDIKKLDFVYFDGNHQKNATLNYFYTCLEKAHNNSIFYFDDIHWSGGMEEAWEEIKKHERTGLTIDLFFSGIVFFKNELSKEDFIIRF